MKKKVLFLLIPLLLAGLTGCVKYNGQPKNGSSKEKVTPSSAEPVNYSIEPSTPPEPHGAGETGDPVDENASVKVYLVFGENGLFEGNPVNDKVADKFLEHTKEITAKVGSDLPGKDKVTSSVKDSTFVAWTAYNNDGKLTEYSKVPAVDGKILYASFTGGAGGAHSGSSGGQGGGGQGGGETQQDEYPGPSTGALPTEGYGLKFSDGTYMAAVHTDDFEGFTQYVVSKRAFKQGQSFSLCNFGSGDTWIVTINEYSFGKNKDQYIAEDTSNLDSSKHKYVVLKDFNAEGIYIKLKFGADEVYMELAH